jgi:tetratricopeptide (TPR) repeat protein
MKSPFFIIFLLVSIFTYAQDTEDFDFYYNEGVKNYDIDNFETALEFFVKALEIEPNHVDTNYKIGNTFSFLGNPYYAIQFLLRTTELDSSHFKAHFNTAAVAYEILEFELSIEYYLKCLPMNESRDLVKQITRIICSALTGLRPSADSALSLFLLAQQERQSLRDR